MADTKSRVRNTSAFSKPPTFGRLMDEMTGEVAPPAAEIETGIQLFDPQTAIVGGKYRFTPIGLEISAEISADEWTAISAMIASFDSAIQWIIGDWLVYGGNRKYHKWDDIEARFFSGKYKADTLRKYARVAAVIHGGIRIPALSFAHHQTVVDCAKPEKYEHWLGVAIAEQLSVSELRRRIKGQAKRNAPPEWERVTKATTRYFSESRWRQLNFESKKQVYDELLALLNKFEEWGAD